MRKTLESWAWLLYIDLLMRFSEFETLKQMVQEEPVRQAPIRTEDAGAICRAIDFACVFYFKPVLCLQRSVVAVMLLRRSGYPASMVIGAQMLPFQSHAWVEIDGVVVNDKPYMQEIFQTLDRF